jgi:uncharacterized protein
MDFEIIDSHSHWGPSLTLGTNVSTRELLNQQEESGISRVVVIPFPSTAIMSNEINTRLLNETRRIPAFIPYFYIREDFPVIPGEFAGGKWHWMRGVQDSASNYNVLDDPELPDFIARLRATDKPVIFEEELSFTERFVDMAPGLKLIVPHLGMLGGNPHDFLKAFKNNEDIYFDTALGARSTILDFVRTVGPSRLLFGSDVPFGAMKSEVSKVLDLPIPDDERELLLSKNIIRLAKLKR